MDSTDLYFYFIVKVYAHDYLLLNFAHKLINTRIKDCLSHHFAAPCLNQQPYSGYSSDVIPRNDESPSTKTTTGVFLKTPYFEHAVLLSGEYFLGSVNELLHKLFHDFIKIFKIFRTEFF